MGDEKQRKERLSIYLAKKGAAGDEAILKVEGARPGIVLAVKGADATLYVKREPPNREPPPWTRLFTSRAEVSPDLFGATRSIGAVLVIRCFERTFALSFGSGFHLLKPEAVERDFGLRATLASVGPNKLRSIDRASYEHNPLNSRTQSTTEVDIFDLQMDSELEMLYAVTGASDVPIFGTHVTGRDAFTVSVEVDLDGIPPLLEEALDRASRPLPVEFEWVDNIRRVKDSDLCGTLDLYLNELLEEPAEKVLWLGEPEVVDWEGHQGYSFDLRASTLRHVVLQLAELLAYMEAHGLPRTAEAMKGQSIHINDAEYRAVKTWSAYRCLYAEINVGDEQFILRNGLWFQVDSDFVSAVDSFLAGVEICAHRFPTYDHDREDEYNEFVAGSDQSFTLMDKKNLQIGGRHDKVEFCDLIRHDGDLVHVKYYRSSGTLSHLFAQGCVAAEAFVRDEEFRSKVNDLLPPPTRLADVKIRPDVGAYRVVYAMATNKSLPQQLPFFSKITLRNSVKTLRALGFGVQLAAIEVSQNLIAKKKCKPRRAA